MGNSRSHLGQKFRSQFLPEEQVEVDRLFDALSSDRSSSDPSPRSFSLRALKSHVGDALPTEMVTRLYDGMRMTAPTGKAKGPSENVSQEQFTMSLSYLLKGNAEEKSLVILKMISAAEGPVKAREVQKFTEELVASVVHVLDYRQELCGWTGKQAPGTTSTAEVLAAQLFSQMKLQGGREPLGPEQLDWDCDQAALEDWAFREPHVSVFLRVVVCEGLLLLCSSLQLASLIPERTVDPGRAFESLLDVLSVTYINSHLPSEQRHRWHLLFSSELHGHSFSQLCGRITHCGPCVTVLEDHDGHIFGGFASCSWEVKPQFQGTSAPGWLPTVTVHVGGLSGVILTPPALAHHLGPQEATRPASPWGLGTALQPSQWPISRGRQVLPVLHLPQPRRVHRHGLQRPLHVLEPRPADDSKRAGHGRAARLLWAVDRRRFRERAQQSQARLHHLQQSAAVGPGELPV
ncbi:MTOR-associated protein MEAK7 isoform X3 [Choloepus didactylus]|nr:MTOR-associated protein MEAK7 isoform X3 [Choloepus didactylus]XP_037671872.1 MTOR-associated protein MEAK7 isoform X3 [Choloepus didactylus]